MKESMFEFKKVLPLKYTNPKVLNTDDPSIDEVQCGDSAVDRALYYTELLYREYVSDDNYDLNTDTDVAEAKFVYNKKYHQDNRTFVVRCYDENGLAMINGADYEVKNKVDMKDLVLAAYRATSLEWEVPKNLKVFLKDKAGREFDVSNTIFKAIENSDVTTNWIFPLDSLLKGYYEYNKSRRVRGEKK